MLFESNDVSKHYGSTLSKNIWYLQYILLEGLFLNFRVKSISDRPIDGPTDRREERQTDTVNYRNSFTV